LDVYQIIINFAMSEAYNLNGRRNQIT